MYANLILVDHHLIIASLVLEIFFMILPIIFYYSNTEIGIPTKGQNQVKQNKYRLKRR